MSKTILFFGKLENYPRQLFFQNAFEQFGHKILYINNNKNIFLRNFLNLKLFFLKFDVIFVSWPGWSDLPFAKILSVIKKKKLIYDCFTTSQEDYLDNFSENISYIKKTIYYFIDIITLKLPDHLITDTKYHKFFISNKYNIKNISCIYISEKKTIHKKININKKQNLINIVFSGAYRNLHGIKNIIDAFKIVNLYNKNINLKLIGTDYGQKFKIMSKEMRIKNIYFYKRLKYKDFINHIENADICLGIFGESIKAHNVISNFLMTSCRLGKIIITLNTEAAKEVFNNHPNSFLINKPIVKNLANTILKLAKTIDIINKNTTTKTIYNKNFNSNVQKEILKKIIFNY